MIQNLYQPYWTSLSMHAIWRNLQKIHQILTEIHQASEIRPNIQDCTALSRNKGRHLLLFQIQAATFPKWQYISYI